MTRTLCLVVAIFAHAIIIGRAVAQPAGNAHPQTALLASEGAANPFGTPVAASGITPGAKHAFAGKVDLAPLRDLAVHHGGRTKILDTLAAETISTITNRRDYYDLEPIPERPASARRLRYDPLFTFLDMIIDPAYYADKALIGVNYLPVREEFIDLEYRATEDRAYWRRVARITPSMVERHITILGRSQNRNDEFRRALGEVHNAHQLFLGSAANLLMAAADHEGEPWTHLASLPADSPAGAAARRLGTAWRNADADGVNAAARDLAAALPQINSAMYPGAKRSMERIYNAARPFDYGVWLYAGSLVSLVLAFGTGRAWLRGLGVGLLAVAVAVHLFGFALRCIIAERYSIQNQFESMTGVSLFAAIVGVVLAVGRRQLVFAAAAAAVGFLILVTATQTAIPGATVQREAAILNTSVLLKYHVTIVLLSYGLIALGCIISVFYLLTHYMKGGAAVASASVGVVAPVGEADGSGADGVKGRILFDLDRAQLSVLQLAFWFLGVGILLGGWWADHSWGRWWGWDPKETWALVTWIIYLIVIHVRLAGIKDRGLTTAWLSVAGFVAMLWCYFGVNLLLPGLHAYA